MHRSAAFALIASLLLASCEDDPVEHGGPSAGWVAGCTPIEGVSWTDINGQSVTAPDPNDWQAMDNWCSEVNALFADRPPVTIATAPPDSLLVVAYPNPTSGMLALAFLREQPSYVEIRIVDEDLEVLYAVDSLIDDHITLDMDTLGGLNGQLVRVYYRIVNEHAVAHRGHGDVQIGN